MKFRSTLLLLRRNFLIYLFLQILDYWPVSKKLMADVMSFLTELKNYNKDDIPVSIYYLI